jgi:hypothetical protein
MKKHLLLRGFAAIAVFLSLQQVSSAAVWAEVGDAGQTIPTSQGTGLPEGTPLSMIFGSLSFPNDVDLYRISITTPSTFSATTVNALTAGSGLDTQLYLFNFNGTPVYANDDEPGGASLQSTLPAGNASGPTLIGTYFLAIATTGNEAVNAVNQLLFSPDSPSDTIRTPAGSGSLASWDSTFGDPSIGAYEIDLTGAFTAVPEASTWFAGALALLAIFFFRTRRLRSRATSAAVLFLAVAVSPAFASSPGFDASAPKNVGNGLSALIDSQKQILKAASSGTSIATYNGYATEMAAGIADLAITDPDTGKFLIDIHPTGVFGVDKLLDFMTSVAPTFQMTAVDRKYKGVGMIEGFVDLEDVAAVAQMAGISSVQLGLKPYNNGVVMPKGAATDGPAPSAPLSQVGSFFDQGVTQHRVDKISQVYNPAAAMNLDGTGMSVGCISNSFNLNTLNTGGVGTNTANDNIAAGDLPGPGNPQGYTTPVTVLQEAPAVTTDEGRGLCQIVFKMIPKANIGYATANIGELSFANNIRALRKMPGFEFPAQTFKADVICDDVGYFDEPAFQDGVIAQAVDDVSTDGCAYFSSAGNSLDVDGYNAPLRPVPNGTGNTFAGGNTALINTNISLAGVPANLIAGGFHNFDPSGNPAKQDIAMTVNVAASGVVPIILQWDDPYDFNGGAVVGSQVYTNSGTNTGATVEFNSGSTPPLPAFTAGQGYILTEMATSGNYDAIVTILKPDNSVLVQQDTGSDETVRFTAPVSGNYRIQFDRFAATTGNFSFTINEATFTQYVTSDWNAMMFNTTTGAFVAGATLGQDNLASNQPIEFFTQLRNGGTQTSIQLVLSRSNTPPPGPQASRVSVRWPANGRAGYGPAEYFTYGGTMSVGHAVAKSCNGTAAYAVFRPSIPEGFTSPGQATIIFDKMNNRLPVPETRLQPTVAAADAGNSSWAQNSTLSADSTADGDTTNNFSGTSAAAPHAAAIAAMVLQAHGGPGSVTPAQMTDVLKRSAFPHDLDPFYSSASIKTNSGGAGKVTISVLSDNSSNQGVSGTPSNNVTTNIGTGLNDPNSFSVGYVGPGFVKSVAFNPNGLDVEGGNPTGGNNGLDAANNYFSNVYPGLIFSAASINGSTAKPFTFGNQSVGLTSGDVVSTLTNQAPVSPAGPSVAGEFWTNTLTFPNNNFTTGRSVRFTIGRGLQHSANVGTYGSPQGGAPFAGPNSGSVGGVGNPHGDLFGGGVLIPEGIVTNNGMRVSVTMDNNITYTGFMLNRIGAGYSPLDGWGFINAEAAVTLPLAP